MRRYSVTVGGQKKEIAVEERAGALPGGQRVSVQLLDRPGQEPGEARELEVRPAPGGGLSWLDGTRVVTAEVQAAPGAGPGGERRKLIVTVAGEALSVEVADAVVELAAALGASARAGSGPLSVRAPMPGRVVKLLCRPGEQVKAGQGILVVEAMKMENEIRAPRDGKVREIVVAEGAAVEAGEPLAVLE